jgi:hypothetical protein
MSHAERGRTEKEVKTFMRLFVFVLALVGAFVVPNQTSAQTSGGGGVLELSDLSISVVDSVTKQPFGQVWVCISSVANSEFYWNGWTDFDGKVSLNVPSNALLVVHVSDDGGHYAQYYGGYSWDEAIKVSLPASIKLALKESPVYTRAFNVTDEKIGPEGAEVRYGIYLENRTDKPKRFTVWAMRGFPNPAPVKGSIPYGQKQEFEKREIVLAPGESKVIYRKFLVLASDPDGWYRVDFYLYNSKGAVINGGTIGFTKGEPARG